MNLANYIGYACKLTGVDPGYLERGFVCINGGDRFADFYLIFLKYPMKMK